MTFSPSAASLVGGGAELGDAPGDLHQHQHVDDQRADHEGELQLVEQAGRGQRIAGRDRVEQQPQHHDQQEVEQDQRLALDVDAGGWSEQDAATRKASSTAVNSGVNSRVSTGAMFSTTLCLASTSHPATTTAATAPQGSSHCETKTSGVDPDGLEGAEHERDQHAAAEGDEDEVDEPFAGEADEVHAPARRAPVVGHIGQTDHEPQRDRQVDAGQRPATASLGERVDVGRHGAEREQRHQDPDQRAPGLPAPGQEGRQPGQREQAEVRRVERAVLVEAQPEQLRHLDRTPPRPPRRRPSTHRSRRDRGSAAGLSVVAGQHQLLPQPFRVLPGELAGQVVEAAHALDRDQERLVGAQADGDELVDGTAQMVFELVGVGRLQSPAALHVLTPLRELGLQLVLTLRRRHASAPSGIAGQRPAVAAAEPDLLERVHDRVPLAALLGQLGQARVGDAVVLAPPLAGDRLPARLHVTEALEPVQQRVQQPLGPVQLATGQLVDPPEDGVAVALALGQDAEHHRCRRGRHEILGDVHVSLPYT